MADTFLTFQKSNQENASAIEPANKKLDKKAVFLPYSGDETAICCDRAFSRKKVSAVSMIQPKFFVVGYTGGKAGEKGRAVSSQS